MCDDDASASHDGGDFRRSAPRLCRERRSPHQAPEPSARRKCPAILGAGLPAAEVHPALAYTISVKSRTCAISQKIARPAVPARSAHHRRCRPTGYVLFVPCRRKRYVCRHSKRVSHSRRGSRRSSGHRTRSRRTRRYSRNQPTDRRFACYRAADERDRCPGRTTRSKLLISAVRLGCIQTSRSKLDRAIRRAGMPERYADVSAPRTRIRCCACVRLPGHRSGSGNTAYMR